MTWNAPKNGMPSGIKNLNMSNNMSICQYVGLNNFEPTKSPTTNQLWLKWLKSSLVRSNGQRRPRTSKKDQKKNCFPPFCSVWQSERDENEIPKSLKWYGYDGYVLISLIPSQRLTFPLQKPWMVSEPSWGGIVL